MYWKNKYIYHTEKGNGWELDWVSWEWFAPFAVAGDGSLKHGQEGFCIDLKKNHVVTCSVNDYLSPVFPTEQEAEAHVIEGLERKEKIFLKLLVKLMSY